MENHPAYKIFIVDDDTFLLNMYSLKFSKNNYEVNTAQNAAEALRKIKDGYLPDIIILDIIMPGMDGLELLHQFRKDKLVPNATIVLLTNQSDASDIEKAKALGVNGYIVKATTVPSEVVDNITAIHKTATQS